MDFLSITISWFLSWGYAQTVSLSRRGLTHIEGINEDDDTTDSVGAGKSTLFEAIVWCLYGKTIKKRSHADAIVHRKRPKKQGTCVSLTLRTEGRGTSYTISRYRKDPTYKNKLFVLSSGIKDGKVWTKEISHLDPKETQALIDKLMGMDYQTFVNSVFFGQGLLARFASLEPSEKHQILEKVIGTEDYSRASKLAAQRAAETRRELQHQLDALKDAKERRAEARERRVEARQNRDAWQREQDEEVASVKKQIAALEDARPADYGDLEGAQKSLKRLREKQEEKTGELSKVERDLAVRKSERRNCSTQIEDLRAEGRLKVGDACATCGATITDKTAAKHRATIETKIERLGAKRKLWDEEIETLNAKLLGLRGELTALRKKVTAKDTTVRGLQSKAREAAADRARLEELRKSLARLEKQTNPYPKIAKQAKRDALRYRRALIEARHSVTALEKKLAAYEFWIKGFGNKGLKSLRLDSSIPALNKYANHFASLLSDGNIKIEISTEDTLRSGEKTQRLNVRATNRWGGDAYEDQSGGEGVKVDLAIALGLQALVGSRSKAKISIGMLDEPTIYLDATGQEMFMKVLADEAKKKSTVLVSTHDDQLKGYFPATITVRKKGGVTTVAP